MHSKFFLLPFCLFLSASIFGQTAIQMTADQIVERAAGQSHIYLDTFKNLLSEEKKSFEVFDKKGEVKKRRTVDSTFLVYQLVKDEGQITEFRNVVAVDGKRLDSTDERAKNFFEKVVASESSQKELDHIQDESTRFDEDFAINGLTLFQAIALSDPLRKAFRFAVAEKETGVYVVSYEQTSANPAITINSSGSHNYDVEIDDNDTQLNSKIRGKLWIDATTFNVRRELRERTIQPAEFDRPLAVAVDTFEYADSEFGILTPQRITHLQFRVKLKDRQAIKDAKVEFDYGKFTRPDVEVKSSDVKAKDH
jgi:hypothetical protein